MNNLMIRPFISDLSAMPAVNWQTIICFVLYFSAVILAALCLSRFAASRFGGRKKVVAICFICIAAVMATLLFCFFGMAAVTFKGILLSLILLYASYSDIRTRECDDYLHLMVVIAAFIGTEASALPGMILASAFIFGIMILAISLVNSTIGGADIKMATACAFLFGLQRGLLGLMIGMLAAIVINWIKNKNKKTGFPMIPYLAAGFMAAYFI